MRSKQLLYCSFYQFINYIYYHYKSYINFTIRIFEYAYIYLISIYTRIGTQKETHKKNNKFKHNSLLCFS